MTMAGWPWAPWGAPSDATAALSPWCQSREGPPEGRVVLQARQGPQGFQASTPHQHLSLCPLAAQPRKQSHSWTPLLQPGLCRPLLPLGQDPSLLSSQSRRPVTPGRPSLRKVPARPGGTWRPRRNHGLRSSVESGDFDPGSPPSSPPPSLLWPPPPGKTQGLRPPDVSAI